MAPDLPPLDSLRAFALVAETGSLSAAAARLNVTQPAISKRLRDLEARLGVALLRRGPNAAHPTEAGAAYAAALSDAFARIGEATAPAARPPAPGALRLQPVLLAPFAAPALARATPLAAMRRLASRVRPGDWAHWHAAHGLEPAAPPLTFESTTLAIQAALEGLGAVVCPPAFVEREVRRRALRRLAPDTIPAGDHYWLVTPAGPLRPEVTAFIAWLREEVLGED